MDITLDPMSPRERMVDRVRRRVGRMPIVGREPELDAIRASLMATVSEASPSVVMLAGDAGIGKSRLLLQACAEMEAAGGMVILGRCADERGMPRFCPGSTSLLPYRQEVPNSPGSMLSSSERSRRAIQEPIA